MSVATAADKKRWDKLHDDLVQADAAKSDFASNLRVKYGDAVIRPSNRHWMSRTERTKLEKLEARVEKAHGRIYELVQRISPRDWGHGVPGHWVTRNLTWEDAIRPANEPLSVVVPGSYGYPDGYVQDNYAPSAYEETTMAHMNAKRRSAPKGRGGSSGGGNPRNDGRITHDEAMRVLRAEYYQGVRGIVQELAERLKEGDIDDWHDAIHQAVGGSYWVIYTHANFQVLLCSDNHDAYMEDMGQVPAEGDSLNWAALAFGALYRDVQQQLEAEGVGPDGELEEAPHRGGMAHEDRVVHGYTFDQWLQAAGLLTAIRQGRSDEDVSMLQSAWLAGEDPAAYRRSAREDRGPRGLRRR
jgi:hypothetical protein